MKPLNQPERRTRLWQFALSYLLALSVPLVASYYLFSNKSIAEENARLTRELDQTRSEQALLVVRFDTLTQHLQRIATLDNQVMAQSDPTLRSVLLYRDENLKSDLVARLSELRNDTAQLKVKAHRQLARNLLEEFEFYRSGRKNLEQLREQTGKLADDQKGSSRLMDELSSARQEASSAKQQVVTLQAALSAASSRGGGGGGGGGGGNPQSPPANSSSKLQIALLIDQLAFGEADCQRQRALAFKARSKERKQLLEQSRTAFIQILQDPATDALRQSIEQTLGPINVELGREPRFFGLIK